MHASRLSQGTTGVAMGCRWLAYPQRPRKEDLQDLLRRLLNFDHQALKGSCHGCHQFGNQVMIATDTAVKDSQLAAACPRMKRHIRKNCELVTPTHQVVFVWHGCMALALFRAAVTRETAATGL